MINNSRNLIRVFKIWAGGVAVFTAGLVGYTISRGIRSLRSYSRPFDPDHIEEVNGIVLEIYHAKESSYDSRGVVLLLDAEDDILMVHVGPTWYVDHQLRNFKQGEELTVLGSRVSYHGEEILVVQTLHRGKKKFRFRDENGSPFWESRVK
jgi:hypothetical protein